MGETPIAYYNKSPTSLTTPADRQRHNQLGDGVYLAGHHPRPGDGAFLANSHSGQSSRGAGPNGFRRGRGGGHRDGWRDGGGNGSHAGMGPRQHAYGERHSQHAEGTAGSSLPTKPVTAGTSSNRDRRPIRPGDAPGLVPANGVQDDSSAVAAHDIADSSEDRSHPQRQQKEKAATRRAQKSSGTSDLGQMPIIKLDPSAADFIPSRAPSSPRSQNRNSESRPTSPHIQSQPDHERPQKAQRGKANGRKAAPASPAGPISSRRAAFDQQTKLTYTMSRKSDGSAPRRVSVAETDARAKKPGKEVKDDLISRLTRGLKSQPFLECPIVRIFCHVNSVPH